MDDQIVPLCERITAIEEKVKCMDRATDTAHKTMEYRLASMNEFREQLHRERSNYVEVKYYNERYANLSKRMETNNSELERRIENLELNKANLEGKLWSVGLITSGIWGFITFIGILLVHFWK